MRRARGLVRFWLWGGIDLLWVIGRGRCRFGGWSDGGSMGNILVRLIFSEKEFNMQFVYTFLFCHLFHRSHYLVYKS